MKTPAFLIAAAAVAAVFYVGHSIKRTADAAVGAVGEVSKKLDKTLVESEHWRKESEKWQQKADELQKVVDQLPETARKTAEGGVKGGSDQLVASTLDAPFNVLRTSADNVGAELKRAEKKISRLFGR